MSKFFIFFLVLISLCTFAFAETEIYLPSETLRVDGLYTVSGVVQESTANLTIESPSGALLVNNVGMTEDGTGVFHYDFVIPNETGTYLASIDYYDVNSTYAGTSSRGFIVAYEPLEFGVCGLNETSRSYLWAFLILCLVGMFIDFIIRIKWIGMLCAGGMAFGSLYLFPCTFLFGFLVFGIGVIGFLVFAFSKD